MSVSRFHPENLTRPGVEIIPIRKNLVKLSFLKKIIFSSKILPLYLAWFGLAKGVPNPELLGRLAPALLAGVERFLIFTSFYLFTNSFLLLLLLFTFALNHHFAIFFVFFLFFFLSWIWHLRDLNLNWIKYTCVSFIKSSSNMRTTCSAAFEVFLIRPLFSWKSTSLPSHSSPPWRLDCIL